MNDILNLIESIPHKYQLIITASVLLLIIIKLINSVIKKNKKLSVYSAIDDIDKEVKKRRDDIDKEVKKRRDGIDKEEREASKRLTDKNREIDKKIGKSRDLDGVLNKKQSEIKQITRTIDLYSNDLELIESGVYEPIFDYETSEQFKLEIVSVKEEQKRMIQSNSACSTPRYFTVDHSEAKGRAHIKRVVKLALRSFNNECEALISKVKWNNIETFAKRMYKSAEMIDKLNSSVGVSIRRGYINLKIKELKLTHEKEVKIQKEKEEQRAIKEMMREEEKARREYENAIRKAEEEEKKYEKMLASAKLQAEQASGEKLGELQAKIDFLNEQLEESKQKSERAISQAQLTRAGHVYVISNIGSFGEDVYKIGLTRRLEPMDRIKELSGASVPFSFDVHAMIYSEDAPSLEKKLHEVFKNNQINKVNNRKEFFKVSLNEIEREVVDMGFDIEFTLLSEAKEYRESLKL